MNIINRAAVIMFTDVVGYTRMMGSDEAGALLLLQTSHRVQKAFTNKYNGHFIKEIGDGLLAYFDSPDDAVRCCMEIQANHAKLDCNIRIGLHYASIILEDGDIFGDGVNIASRIEPLADPGGIYISDDLNKALHQDQGISTVMMGKAKLKNVKTPLVIYAVQGNHLPKPNRRRFQKLANPRIKLTAIPALIVFFFVLTLLSFFTLNFFSKRESIQKARESLIEIERLVQNSWRDYSKAYDLAMIASEWIPGDPKLIKLIELSSFEINVSTEPSGAEVFIKRYSEPNAPWQSIGVTPIKSVRLAISIYRWKVEKKGYETVLAAEPSFDFNVFTDLRKEILFKPNHFSRKLDPVKSIPDGMIRITGSEKPYGKLDDFFIDKLEVTNLAYKKFVDAGGYNRKEFWREKFVDNNIEIPWKDVAKRFTDKTGYPGPASWENGSYPKGEENFPVSGVSWYEAKAYAVFAGKDLPTGDHWGLAQGENTFLIRWPHVGGYALFAPFSNFNNKGPVEAGTLDGITSYGAFDMAGNVQEWCDNNSPAGKLIRGGGWKSNTYMFSNPIQAPPLDRSETNGFRCVLYLDKNAVPPQAFGLVNLKVTSVDPKERGNVSDEVFKIYKTFYDYDPTPLNAVFISGDDSNPDWIHERVEIDAAYGNERIILHLFLPKNVKPPFQTVLYGPGSASFFQLNSNRIAEYYEFPVFLDFIVRSGRAVVYPVIQGTFERRKDILSFIHKAEESLKYTEFITQVIKDYRRSIDYLVTRNDIDPDRIAFYGMSWGPTVGTLLSGVETRIKVNVFISGGIAETGRSEVNPWKFASRVKVPTLMINGRFDSVYPISLCIQPFYSALGAEKGQKKLALFDTDHIPPREGMVAETLEWFDKYLK